MKRSLILLLCSLGLGLICPPAFAADGDAKSVAKTVAMAPIRVAGCFTAIMAGTPIAIARLAKKQYKDYAEDGKDMDGDAGGGRVLSIPMSLGDGIAQGLYYGPRNAIANFEHPFSRAQFSLEGSPDGK